MTGTEEEPREENAGFLVAGVVLGILASMSGTAGKQFLRFSELQRRKGTPAALCVGKAAFALGLALNIIIGPLIDMGSYAFAPQSVIAPLGGLDVVWNTLTAPFTLGETLTLRLFLGCAVITGGAIVTSLTGSHDSGEFTVDTVQAIILRPAVLFYLLVLGAWLLFNVLVLLPRSAAPKGQPWQSGDRIRGLSLGMTAGSISGQMFCVKAFVEVVQDSIRNNDGGAWLHWLPYGLFAGALFFAFSNLYFLTKAMREYEALFMGAVFEGSLIISACTSGVVVFSELERLQPWQIGLYWAAILSIVGGIYVVCTGSAPAAPEPKDVTDGKAGEQAGEQAEEEGEAGPEAKAMDAPAAGAKGGRGGGGGSPDSTAGIALEDVEKQLDSHARQDIQCECPSCATECKIEDAVLCRPNGRAAGSDALGRKGPNVSVVPSSALPQHLQDMNGISCMCADGISCFCGMHFLRSKRSKSAPRTVPLRPVLCP